VNEVPGWKPTTLAVALVLTLATPATAHSSLGVVVRNADQRLVFVGFPTGSFTPDLWTMRSDGSERQRLTSDGDYRNPAWSPDHSRLAFSRSGQVFVMRPDRSRQRLITRGDEPTWSPDARQLAFTSGSGISVVSLGSRRVRPVTNDPRDAQPAWSPDGTIIAFKRGTNLFTISPQTLSEIQLTRYVDPPPDESYSLQASHPAWSPDGSQIAFAGGTNGPCFFSFGIRLIDFNGENDRDVPGMSLFSYWNGATGVTWSPDGQRIVFDAELYVESLPGCDAIFTSRDIFSGEVSTGQVSNLTKTDSFEELDPDW